jgi:hypothetical protein
MMIIRMHRPVPNKNEDTHSPDTFLNKKLASFPPSSLRSTTFQFSLFRSLKLTLSLVCSVICREE